MKVGDKILCKRSVSNKSKHERMFFVRGKYYEVVRYNEFPNITYITLRNERGNLTDFTLNNIDKNKRLYRFFYTDKEIRRIKLERINLI